MIAHVGILLALLALTHQVTKGNRKIMIDISALKADQEALTAVVGQISPVLQASTDITMRMVAVVEALLKQISETGPTQDEIDALHVSGGTALATLQADLAQLNANNAALQTEIGKATPPATPPTV